MKRRILVFCCLLLVVLISGCSSKEQQKEKKAIENDVKQIMIEYLQNNYNISEVYDVEAEYINDSDFSPLYFSGIVIANFKIEGQIYQILYNHQEKKCYDSYSYIKKINPILTNYVKSILDKYSINNIAKPDCIVFFDKFYRYLNLSHNSYGFFDNYDIVNTYEDIINYYDEPLKIEIIYNSLNTVIDGNIDVFEALSKELNNRIEVTVYNDGMIKERFVHKIESSENYYYMNEIQKNGDFTSYWNIKEIQPNLENNKKSNFKIYLTENDYFYKKNILDNYGNEYVLYSNKILVVENISDNENSNFLYLKLNDKFQNSKCNIVYDGYQFHDNSSRFLPGETKRFAIYCRK